MTGARAVGLVVFGLLLALILGEVGLRVVQPFSSESLLPLVYKRDRLRRLANGDTYVRFDRELGWVTNPDTVRRDTRVTYQNNRAGLRADREYPTEAPSGIRRLAAFGESFTYCQEVDASDCWTDKLEKLWPGTEVLNFGVPGYGPDQAWLRYQRDGGQYASCAVLIGFMVENVNRVVNRFYPFYQPDTGLVAGKPRFLLAADGLSLLPSPVSDPGQLEDPAWVEAALGPEDRWYYPGLFTPRLLDSLSLFRVGRTARYRFERDDAPTRRMRASYQSEDEAYQITGRILVAASRQVRSTGATPVVILFSPASEIDAIVHGSPPVHAPLVAWLQREGISVVDTTDAVVAEARQVGVDPLIQFHYRPQGNEIIARVLAEMLPGRVGATCPP